MTPSEAWLARLRELRESRSERLVAARYGGTERRTTGEQGAMSLLVPGTAPAVVTTWAEDTKGRVA